MSQLHHLPHLIHHATHAKGKDAIIAGIVLLVVGFFFTPCLIGIPIMIFGVVKLFHGFGDK